MTFYIPIWLFWFVGVPAGIIVLVLAWFGYQAVKILLEMWNSWH